MVKLYDRIADKLPETESGEFYLQCVERGFLYSETALTKEIYAFDEITRPIYNKLFRNIKRKRYIDFNFSYYIITNFRKSQFSFGFIIQLFTTFWNT